MIHRDLPRRLLAVLALGITTVGMSQVVSSAAVPPAFAAAECDATSPDDMGTGPSRSVDLTGVDAGCWSFAAPGGASYFVRAAPDAGAASAVHSELRSADGAFACAADATTCAVPAAGQYLLVVSSAPPGAGDVGTVRVGLWRVDRPTSCPKVRTAFTSAPMHGDLSTALELDCSRFGGSAGEHVFVRSVPDDNSVEHRIVDRTGAPVCIAANGTCILSGAGPYRVLSFATSDTGRYAFRVASLTRALGCGAMATLPFGRGPRRSFELTAPTDLRCYQLNRGAGSGELAIRMVDLQDTRTSPTVSVFDSARNSVCTSFDEFHACFDSGAGTYLLVVQSRAPVRGTLGAYDLGATTGCRAGPSGAFGDPAARGRVGERGSIDCILLPYAARDEARIALGPRSDTEFGLSVVAGTGTESCEFDSWWSGAADCTLARSVNGPVRALVRVPEWAPLHTGAYRLHAWRLNDPAGCTDIGSLRDGFGPLVGTLRDGSDEACYTGVARAGELAISASNDEAPSAVPQVQVLRRDSARVACSQQPDGTCILFAGTVSILVAGRGGPVFPGHYRVTADCTSGQCGP